jgi:hypothetical protein
MRTQRRVAKISTAISLLGLALGFSVLGLLIVANEHDDSTSIIGGIIGILLGAAFLIAACLHWKCGNTIQDGFRIKEVPAAEIVSEMRQAAAASAVFENLNDLTRSLRIVDKAIAVFATLDFMLSKNSACFACGSVIMICGSQPATKRTNTFSKRSAANYRTLQRALSLS